MSQTQTMTNGDSSSKLIDHVTSYPVVSEGIATFKSNPYGRKSMDLSNETYKKFVEPLAPYAQRPYGMVAPYVQKVDSMASGGLDRVDKTFPIVTQDTQYIKDTLINLAYAPFRIVFEGRDYVLDTYSQEYKKCGGDGYVSGGKALITTGLVVTSDSLSWLTTFLTQKKDEGTHFAAEKYGQASQFANDRSAAAVKYAQEKSEEAKQMAYMKSKEAQDMAKNAQATVQSKAQQAKDKADKASK